MSVGQTADEGAGQLDELHREQDDAEQRVHLGDLGLPEREVHGEILSWDSEHQDPEHHRDLLAEVVFLTKIQSCCFQPTQSQQQEHLVQENQ